ncbi:MAG: PBP1A family penicillin-binding protein [Henriciella sp.]|nr:PBP1A family penicillin-binding protein [Henriciella sp.]
MKYGLIAAAGLVLIGGLSAFLYWQSLYRGMPTLPETDELWEVNAGAAIEFVDASGNTLAIRGPRYGRKVTLEELPAYVPRAFIAAEDKRFYDHDGADTQAMIRALWSNATSGRTVSGASTITQQVVKNLILSSEQTIKRKVQEVRLARQLEKRVSKDQILELYLNQIYFGSGFYGLGAAARFYFGKDPQDLTLAEASLLATLPQAPSRLALNRNMGDAKTRQTYVLSEMVAAGFITPESAQIAMDSDVTLTEPSEKDPQFGYILDLAKERAERLLPVVPDDLVITLTVDRDVQNQIVEVIEARMQEESEEANAGQAAAIIMKKTGEIVALYGGRDYLENQYNRATQAKRQPGSAFKPFVYAAALEAGITPYDVRIDEPVVIDKWAPKNFSRVYVGPVTVNEALRDSLNTIAALLGQEAGEDSIIKLAQRFGINSTLRPLPSIALGSQEVSLWELTRAYGPFMTGGKRVDPYLVAKIESSRGEILYERPEYEAAVVYPKENADLMAGMLASVVRDGTGKAADLERWPIAGKTGTSQSFRDAWFVGFSAELLGGVWTGNDDDTPMTEVTGGGLPSRIWHDMMIVAHEGLRPSQLVGASRLMLLTPDQEQRVAYYRDLGLAFSGVVAN